MKNALDFGLFCPVVGVFGVSPVLAASVALRAGENGTLHDDATAAGDEHGYWGAGG